jgi:hypothetical protein
MLEGTAFCYPADTEGEAKNRSRRGDGESNLPLTENRIADIWFLVSPFTAVLYSLD